MRDPQKIFKEYCKDRNMRCTPVREIILKEVYFQDGHFDIDELFIRLRKKYPQKRVSKASIYRNIPLFIEAGLIRESMNREGRSTYEHTLGHSHHAHMKCVKCGKIIEFYDKRIDKAQEDMCKSHNFKMVTHIHVINGLCKKCNAGAGSKPTRKRR